MVKTKQPWMSYSEMAAISEEANIALLNGVLRTVEQLEPYAWLLRFDRSALLIAMKGCFARFHLTKLSPRGAPAPFAHKLQGHHLEKLALAGEDRILLLQFAEGEMLAFEFFPGGKFFCGKEYRPPPLPHPHKREPCTLTSAQLEKRTLGAMEEIFQEQWRTRVEKQCAKIEQEIEEGKRFKEAEHEAQLLQANLYRLRKGMTSVEVEDWGASGAPRILALDPMLEPAKQVERRFKKARKLKRKQEIAGQRLEELRRTLDHPPPMTLPCRSLPKAKESKAYPYRACTTAAGLKIYIGKKDRDNDTLTFRFADGSDYWFHAADFPGSHVVLKVKKKEEPDPESFKDALQLALHFSKAKGSAADVVATQCKYLSKPKGAKPGLVHLSKHRKYRVRPDQARLARLLKQSQDR